ncbi:MAG: Gfo/Idh/MocA family oxidoreductase [Ruminococcaceae bacterium]|nr:Gfo/Idh/MocA family oxidoreductase [Oscillospiraceae bacterium]
MNKTIKTGVIGLGARGSQLLETILACEESEVVALCDLYEDRREKGKKMVEEKLGKSPAVYENYKDLIADENVEAVFVISSWDMHTRMAVESMKAGKITALEVAGAYDIEDCWQLVRTYEETGTPIMLLENCCFDRFELLTSAMAKDGRFGKIVYCHGAYAHELRDEVLGGHVKRHYRLENYMYRNCENYPTHELGPIAKVLGINRGNKMLHLSSVSTRSGVGLETFAKDERNPDPSLRDTKFNQGDIILTTITCAGGEVITLRLDTTLPRSYSREFTLRGTAGFCQQDQNLVMLEETDNMHETFVPAVMMSKYMDSAEKYAEEYLPDAWKNITEEEKLLGHGGMDYIELKAFFRAALNGEEMPIDVYDAAAWMAITPLSEQSIAMGGTPQPVPDFTRGAWMLREPRDVVELPKPNAAKGEVVNSFGKSRAVAASDENK